MTDAAAPGTVPDSTPRLDFRLWREDDLPLALGLWGDPRVTRLIDARGVLDPLRVRDRLYREIDAQRRHGVQYWPVFLRDGGDHVGCCGLRAHRCDEGVYEIGFHLRVDYWRRGLAREAAGAAIAHAFATLGATALFAGHNPANTASRHLLERLGFCYTHDEYYPPTGLMHPSYRLAAPPDGAPGAEATYTMDGP